jgi:hypothetical protein
VSSGLLCRVALVRTDVSEEPGASFIRVTKIGAVGTTQAATSTNVRCEEILPQSYINQFWKDYSGSPCGGGLKYLHHSPTSGKRR